MNKKFNAIKNVLALLVAILLFASCNQQPSESQMKQQFGDYIARQSRGSIQLSTFAKTNGISQEEMGQKLYQCEFKALVQFTRGCYKNDNAFMGGPFTDFNSYDRTSDFSLNPMGFYKNALVAINGQLTFLKKERGWEFQEYKCSGSQVTKNMSPMCATWHLKTKSSDVLMDQISISQNRLIFTPSQEYSRVGYAPQSFNLQRIPAGGLIKGRLDYSGPDDPPGFRLLGYTLTLRNDNELVFAVPTEHSETVYVK